MLACVGADEMGLCLLDPSVAAYLPIVQSFLPRILNAAAPPGGAARENRKQCLKVSGVYGDCWGILFSWAFSIVGARIHSFIYFILLVRQGSVGGCYTGRVLGFSIDRLLSGRR